MSPRPPSPQLTGMRARAWRAILAAGGAGVLVQLGLALFQPALAVHLLSGAGAVAIAAAATAWWALRPAPVAATLATDSPPASNPVEGPSLHEEALDGLIDPVMVVEGGDPDDPAAPRIAFANRAARDLFRLQGEGGLLVTAVRDPEVLEVVDEALYGDPGIRVAEYQPGGATDRYWRATSKRER